VVAGRGPAPFDDNRKVTGGKLGGLERADDLEAGRIAQAHEDALGIASGPRRQHPRLGLGDRALINDLVSSYVFLPAQHLVPRASKLRSWPKAASLPQVIRILVIEDDRPISDLLRQVLSDEGYELMLVDGLDRVPADAAPDLIITDLAGLHGYESGLARAFVLRVQQRYPKTPIIVCTSYAQAMAESDQLGAAAVLRKPFMIEALIQTVARIASK
jgi:CheY-like chemotaxis protein